MGYSKLTPAITQPVDTSMDNYQTAMTVFTVEMQKALNDISKNQALEKSKEAVDNVKVGGKNLLLESNRDITSSEYNIAKYELTESIPEGSEVTVSMKAILGSGKVYFGLYNSGGSLSVAQLYPTDITDGVWTKTFKWRVGTTANTHLLVYHMANSVVVESTIEWIQLEYGNKVTTYKMSPQEIQIKGTDGEEGQSTSTMKADKDQVSISSLSVDNLYVKNIINDNVVLSSTEDMTFYVSSTGDDQNDGTSISTAYATVAKALENIPRVYEGTCTIYIRTLNLSENIDVRGYMGKGSIQFKGCNSTGTPATAPIDNQVAFTIAGCTIDTYIDMINILTEPGVHGVKLDNARCRLGLVKITGSNGAESACYVTSNSFLEWRGGECNYVARGVQALNGSSVYLSNVNVYANDYSLVSAYASIIDYSGCTLKGATSKWTGSILDGKLQTTTPPPTTITQPAPKPVYKTETVTSINAGHYYTSSWYWGGTFMSGYPIQGKWGTYPMRQGFWFFGTRLDKFVGKTITKVRVYVGRSSYNSQGHTGSRKFTLAMHNQASKPSTSSSVVPTFYGSYSGYLAFGETKWFDVTSSFKTLVSSSSPKGFGVRTTSTSNYEYMAMLSLIHI